MQPGKKNTVFFLNVFFPSSFFFFLKENKPTGPVHISTKPDYGGFSAGVGIYNVLLIIICLIFAEY